MKRLSWFLPSILKFGQIENKSTLSNEICPNCEGYIVVHRRFLFFFNWPILEGRFFFVGFLEARKITSEIFEITFKKLSTIHIDLLCNLLFQTIMTLWSAVTAKRCSTTCQILLITKSITASYVSPASVLPKLAVQKMMAEIQVW